MNGERILHVTYVVLINRHFTFLYINQSIIYFCYIFIIKYTRVCAQLLLEEHKIKAQGVVQALDTSKGEHSNIKSEYF